MEQKFRRAISTYVIHGEPGSRCCILNGAAARTCQVRDEIIIAASTFCEPKGLYNLKPRVVTFLPDNKADRVLCYDVFKSDANDFDFRTIDTTDDGESAREWSRPLLRA